MAIRLLLALLLISSAALLLMATAPRKGSLHASQATSDVERTFTGSVSNLLVKTDLADVVVIHRPHYANQDTFKVNGGDDFLWEGVSIYGFQIIRIDSTAVDVFWW